MRYNHTRVESIDKTQATFSLTDTWIYAFNYPALEDYTISNRETPEDMVTQTVVINGTVKGLALSGGPGPNQLHTRIDNAISYFDAYVKPNLYTRISSQFPDLGINPGGSSGNIDYQYVEGQIVYSFEFNNRPGDENYYESFTVSKKTSMDSREITVIVSGTITGRLKLGEAYQPLLKYERAKAYFDSINNNTFMHTRALLSGVGDLKPAYINVDISQNFQEGTISYSYEFNNREDNKVKHEYTLELRTNREDGKVTVAINGTITGLKENESDPVSVKYANAVEFFNGWVIQIPGVVQAFAPDVVLNPNPYSRTRGDNAYNGIITYAYEYNTDPIPTIPGALTQNITIQYGHGGQVIAIIPVLGRPAGPVLQDIGTIKEKTKTLTIDVVMEPNSDQPNTDSVVSAYVPDNPEVYVDNDEETWVESTFRYNRVVRWILQ
jgi:hypothetical protein